MPSQHDQHALYTIQLLMRFITFECELKQKPKAINLEKLANSCFVCYTLLLTYLCSTPVFIKLLNIATGKLDLVRLIIFLGYSANSIPISSVSTNHNYGFSVL